MCASRRYRFVSTSHPKLELSPRERDVAGLVAKGFDNRSIGHKLKISESCVKHHVKHIFEKKNFRNRTELALWAVSRIGEHDHDRYDP